jgi:hypothetical protein
LYLPSQARNDGIGGESTVTWWLRGLFKCQGTHKNYTQKCYLVQDNIFLKFCEIVVLGAFGMFRVFL